MVFPQKFGWILIIAFSVLSALLTPGSTRAQAKGEDKKLMIQFGWHMPDTHYIYTNQTKFQSTPFDGLVFEVGYLPPSPDYPPRYSNAVLGPRLIPWESVWQSVQEMNAMQMKRLVHNFVRVNISAMATDWFGNREDTVQNVRMLGRYMAATGTKGLFLDLEHYNSPIFNFNALVAAEVALGKTAPTFAEYNGKAYLLGRRFVNAMAGENQQFEIYLSFMYEQIGDAKVALSDRKYALLPAFLDGIMSAVVPGITVVNANQRGYAFRTAAEMQRGYEIIGLSARAYSKLPDLPGRPKSLNSNALWIDLQRPTLPFSFTALNRNYFSPARLRSAAIAALNRSDKYLMLYSQNLSWWWRENYPAPYFSALRDVRRAFGREP